VCHIHRFRSLFFANQHSRSTVPPAREDGQDKRGSRRPEREFRTYQEAARYRLTVRRACGQPSETTIVWRPVYFDIIASFQVKGGSSPCAEISTACQEGPARNGWTCTKLNASLRTQASSNGTRVRLNDMITIQLVFLELLERIDDDISASDCYTQ